MQWKFWDNSGLRPLPDTVKKALRSQYHLSEGDSAQWQFLGKNGQFAKRPVRFIAIVAPEKMKGGQQHGLKYDDFARRPELRDALIFEGHIEKDGSVYLADRRQTVASGRKQ